MTEKRLTESRIHETLPSGDTSISPQFIGALSKILSAYETPDDAFSAIGDDALRSILEDTDPTLVEYLNEGKEELDGDLGFFILKRTGIDHLELPLAQFTAIAVSSFFGSPTKPSPRSQVIAWPIDYTAETGTPGVTFSQTNAEATMHTDTQYFLAPEPYFGLFCLRPAIDGGGMSQLVDSRVLLKDISETDGVEVLTELAKPFPFKVPDIFKKDPVDQIPEITWAPIVTPKGIRFRKDTLFDALGVEGVTITRAQLRAVESIEDALGRIPSTDYALEAGDVIFVNNYRILHGRTAFVDSDRLMLRVRMK